MNIGIIRSVDGLGRIVVPKEIRQKLGIDKGTPMEILASTEGIMIRKSYPEKELPAMVESCIAAVEGTQTLGPEKIERIKQHLQEIQILIKQQDADPGIEA